MIRRKIFLLVTIVSLLLISYGYAPFSQAAHDFQGRTLFADVPFQEAPLILPARLGGSTAKITLWGAMQLQVSALPIPFHFFIFDLRVSEMNITIPTTTLFADLDRDHRPDRIELGDITISAEDIDQTKSKVLFNLLTGKFSAAVTANVKVLIKTEPTRTAGGEEVINMTIKGQGQGSFNRFTSAIRAARGAFRILDGPLAGATITLKQGARHEH